LSRLNGVQELFSSSLRASVPDEYDLGIHHELDDQANVRGVLAGLASARSNIATAGVSVRTDGFLKECGRAFDDVCWKGNTFMCHKVDNSWKGIEDIVRRQDCFPMVDEAKKDSGEGESEEGPSRSNSPVPEFVDGGGGGVVATLSASQSSSSAATKVKSKPAAKKKAPAKKKTEITYTVGQPIEARFDRKALWYRGTIVTVYEGAAGNMYGISYEDGDFDDAFESKFVRARREKGKAKVAGAGEEAVVKVE